MRLPSKAHLAALRRQFPTGARVMLDAMEDVQAPKIGTLGTVTGVDDCGSIMVKGDIDSSPRILLGIDLADGLRQVHRVD